MPGINVPLPPLHGGCVLLKTIQAQSNTLVFQGMYSNHWFTKVGGSGPLNILQLAADFNTQWFQPVFANLGSTDCGTIGFHIFSTAGTHTQAVIFSPHTTLGPSVSISPSLCVTYKRTAIIGSTFLATYCRMPPVCRAHVEGNDLSPLGEVDYAGSLSFYMNAVTSQGLTFLPAASSFSLATIAPLVKVERCPLIRILRKRRIKDASHKKAYVWPNIF
jgi:hypothetical protein